MLYHVMLIGYSWIGLIEKYVSSSCNVLLSVYVYLHVLSLINTTLLTIGAGAMSQQASVIIFWVVLSVTATNKA